MARRGPNEGTIRKRKDGRWEARLLVTLPDGRRTRRSYLGRNRATAVARLRDAASAEASCIAATDATLTFGAFLDQWLAESARPSVRPSTFKSYRHMVTVHLQPGLGHVPLVKLTPLRLQCFLNAKVADGLSPRTVAYIRAVARQALCQAERWGLVTRNVAKLTDAPRVPRRPVHPLEPHEIRRFFAAIAGDRLETLYLAAIGTGLRQGELLGLGWDEVDLEAGTITVRHALQRVEGVLVLVEPKSASSHRTIAMPAFVATALRAHRRRQHEARLLTGARWVDDARDLVFRTTIGTPLDGITVTRRLQSQLRSAGLRHQRFHDLRHACASLMLAQGVAPRVVMEVLGHSQISLTMNTYAHVTPALGRSAAERLDELIAIAPAV